MKPFNIKEAKEGKAVVTRDGRSVRILCYDLAEKSFPIVAAIKEIDGTEYIETFTNTGNSYDGSYDGLQEVIVYCEEDFISIDDLFMKTLNKEAKNS